MHGVIKEVDIIDWLLILVMLQDASLSAVCGT
jgi:hypothetical protein